VILAALTLESVISGLITPVIMAAATGGATLLVIKSELKRLVARHDATEKKVEALKNDVAALRLERSQCELRSAHEYSSRADIARLTSDQVANYQQIIARLDKAAEKNSADLGRVHQRLDDAVKDLAVLKGQQQGKE
jgi:flagellar biosynthesis chaperone FliJ